MNVFLLALRSKCIGSLLLFRRAACCQRYFRSANGDRGVVTAKSRLPSAFCLLVFCFIFSTAEAVVVDLQATPITINQRSLSFDVGGINVTATGYKAERDASSGTFTIYGPFTTGIVGSTPSFTYPGFGRTGLVGQPNDYITGLMLYSAENLGQMDIDSGGGQFSPGFDNQKSVLGDPSVFDFAVFEFSVPVNVSQVIVDDVSNFGREIWAAGNDAAPDLALDFLGAFGGFDFRNSIDDPTDGFFTHTFSPLNGIRYLAVGAPPDMDLGPLTGRSGGQQFYIEGLNITAVPMPAAAWLFGSALALLGWTRRRHA